MGSLDHLKDRFEGQQEAVTPETEPTLKKSGASLKDRLGDRFEGSDASNAQGNLNLVREGGLTAEKEASAYNLSKKNNMTLNLAREAEKIPEAQRVFPLSRTNLSPPISRYMGKQLNNAGVSQGDEDNLLEVERAVNNEVHGFVGVNGEIVTDVEGIPLMKSFEPMPEVNNMTLTEKAKRSFDIGRHNLTLGTMRYNQIFGEDTPEAEEAINRFKKRIPSSVEGDNIFEDLVIATSSMTPLVVDSFIESQKEGLAAATGAGVAALVGGQVPPFTAAPEELITVPVATSLGYGAGIVYGAGKNIFEQEAGLMYDELLSVRDENGRPIDRTVAKTAAIGYASISTIFEMAGLKYISKTIPGGQKILGKLTKEPIKKLLKNPSTRKLLLDVGKKWIVAGTGEASTEAIQESAAILITQLAKLYETEKEGAYFLPFDWRAAFKRVGSAGYQGGLGGLGLGSAGTLASGAKIAHDVNSSKKFTNNIEATRDTLAKTKTISLSPDHAERFVNETELIKEGEISPEGIDSLFQSDKVEAEAIFKKLGINPKDARRSLAAGQDVSISNSKALAQLTEEEWGLVKQYLKPKPDTYTEKQVQEKEPQQDAEQLKETFKDIVEDERNFQDALENIKKQITGVGFSNEFAEANAIILEKFSNGLALEGQDRKAFLDKIVIKREKFTQKLLERGRRLFQPATPEAEMLSLEIAQLETRINKLDPDVAGASQLINRLQQEKVRAEEKLADTAITGFDILLQAKRKDPKAMINFVVDQEAKDKAIISLFQRADESSIPHELGHLFLQEMTQVEDIEDISDQFKSNMDTLRKWLGAEKGAGYTRKQQEKFAEGWEQFLREGKAPTVELTTVFARFQRWLKEIYKTARNLGVKIPDSVRTVFNRMLDADSDTKTAAAFNNMVAPTTERMNALGIPNDIQVNIKSLVDIATEKAEHQLFKDRSKAVRDNKARFTKESEAEILAEDTAKYGLFGVYGAIDDMKANNIQFSRSEYNEADGSPNAYKFLPAKNLTSTKEEALSLDDVAFIYDFDSADTFVEAFATTAPLDIAIQNRVNQKNRMLEDTFRSEDYLAQTKEYADYISIMGDHLRKAEARAIQAGLRPTIKVTKGKLAGREFPVSRKVIAREQMKAFAQSVIDEMSVIEAQRTDKFMAAMKRAGVAQIKAEKKNDFATAIRENEKMQLNHEMANISVRNKRFVQSFIKRAKTFRKLGKPASVSLRFREGVRSLIERFNVVPGVAPQKIVNIEALQKLLKGDGHIGEFIPSDFLLSEKQRDYRNLSTLELKELDNMMKFLRKLGKDEQTGLLSDGVTKKEDVVKGSVEEMNSINPIKVRDRFSIARKTSDVSRRFLSRLLGITYITKALGGYKALRGVQSFLETNITEKLKDIEDSRLRRYDVVTKEILDSTKHIGNAQRRLLKQFGQKLLVEDNKVPVPEVLQDSGSQLNYWTPEQIFVLAFNRGTDSNTDAVLKGYPGLTIDQIDALLNKYLTKEDIKVVQNIIDAMESLFAETDAVHVKMKGFHMDKVPARPWTFKGEIIKGGYYPLNFDRVLSDWIAGQKETQDFFESEDAKFTVPYAAQNHTIKRIKGHALPVDLRLIHIYKHFDKAVRYITHAETIRDIDRIINDPEFKSAAIKALGKDVYKQIRPALKDVANPHIPGVDIPGKRMVGYLRSVATASNLAINTMVAMKQVFSTPSAIHDMGLGDGGGFKAYLRGMVSVVSSPSVHFNTMLKMSPYMKERITSWERDLLRPKFNRMTPAKREIAFGDRHVTWDDVVNLGFFEIKAMDTATVLPIWWGTYYDTLNENSTNEAEAIRKADNIVRDTQPSATALDLSAWFREGGFFSLFNIHQTFTVGKYGQRQRTYYDAWRDGKISTLDYAWFNFMDAFIPLVSINVMVAFLKGGDLTDKEDWWDIAEKAVSSWLFMGIPLVNSFYDAITKGWRDPLEIPGARQVKRTARTIGHLGQGTSNIITGESLSDKEKQQLYWGMADIVSDFSRVPISKVSKKALKGEGFKEKIFGKQFKKK